MIGYFAGVCYGSDVSDDKKNIKRGKECLKTNHGRTFEFPDVYLIIDEYSAKVVREWYTHIGGSPTRLQESTRYIDYSTDMKYITPKTIEADPIAKEKYDHCMQEIWNIERELLDIGVPKEDASYILPLGMKTMITAKHNLRNLMDMSKQRMCSRALWEYRDLFNELCEELSNYSDQWKYIVQNYFMPKCEVLGYCPESRSCGRKLKRKANV